MTVAPPPDLSKLRRERSKVVVLNVVSVLVLVAAMVVGLGAAIGPLIP